MVATSILKDLKNKAWALVSLSKPLKDNGNLDRVKLIGLKIWSWTIKGCL